MSKQFRLLLILSIVFIACHKGNDIAPPIVEPPPPIPNIFLKEIQIDHLPSPYYHFEYNSTGQIVVVSFASGLDIYQVSYNNGRISEMKNSGPANNDKLEYSYDNMGRINMVSYIDVAGILITKVLLNYDGQKLVTLTRQKKINSDFVIDKTMSFSYNPDGNVSEIVQHRFAVAGQTDAIYSDKFEQYDDKINTDGFSLIHDDFFDNLILLPGIQFQKNNPGKVTHSGDGENFKFVSTYTYNDKNLPISRSDEITILTGTNAGQIFQGAASYTYY